MTSPTASARFIPDLANVVATKTRLSSVSGLEGELIIAGFPVEEIASQATFEEMMYLLWNHSLPTVTQLADCRQAMVAQRVLPLATVDVLGTAAARGLPALDALSMAGTLILDLANAGAQQQAMAVLASFPIMLATYVRLLNDQTPLAPRA